MLPKVVILILALSTISGCFSSNDDAMVLTGTVVYISLEGGFYGIKGDNGKNYDPVNLKEEFQRDGLRIRFEMKELKNQASFHMWGMLVEIINVETIER